MSLVELAQEVVVLSHRALALENLDENSRLVVRIGREGLRLLGGNGGVPLDELGHDAAGSLQAHGQGSHVQQQQVLDLRGALTSEDGSLDSSAEGNGLIRIDGLA